MDVFKDIVVSDNDDDNPDTTDDDKGMTAGEIDDEKQQDFLYFVRVK